MEHSKSILYAPYTLSQVMTQDLGFGPKLSDDEYERAVVALQRYQPTMPNREQDMALLKQELELAIDHRLGIDFPREKRNAMWEVRHRIEKKRVRMLMKYYLKMMIGRTTVPNGLLNEANGLAGFMMDAYAEVLTEEQLRSFLGLESEDRPVLPPPGV